MAEYVHSPYLLSPSRLPLPPNGNLEKVLSGRNRRAACESLARMLNTLKGDAERRALVHFVAHETTGVEEILEPSPSRLDLRYEQTVSLLAGLVLGVMGVR